MTAFIVIGLFLLVAGILLLFRQSGPRQNAAGIAAIVGGAGLAVYGFVGPISDLLEHGL